MMVDESITAPSVTVVMNSVRKYKRVNFHKAENGVTGIHSHLCEYTLHQDLAVRQSRLRVESGVLKP